MSSTFAQDTTNLKAVVKAYGAVDASRRSPSFGGSLFAFADTDGGSPGSTAQHVTTYGLTGFVAANGRANVYPALDSAAVRLPGAEQIVGAGSTPLPSPSVSISSNYLANGFQAGVTEVYLEVKQNAPGLSFPANLVGGMATPNFDVSGIARDLGPVGGDLNDLLAGKFDPSKYFNMLSGDAGKLLGAISVADIIALIDPNDAASNAQAPQISDKIIYPDDDDTKPPTALDVKIDWTPTVTGDKPGFFQPGSNAALTIQAEIYTPVADPSQTTYSIHGDLTDFGLLLFGNDSPFILVSFNSFTFDSKTGAKTSIQPDIDSVTFKGPLTFIQDFEELLSSLGGPSISVTDGGINASYSLALPDIGLGVFSLQNLALSAGVTIPFDGTPVRVRFGLSSRDNPFILTIDLFGGGGFFSLAIGADGIEMIEVSLEFGADLSIDLGVASGGVSIMAGIYFSLQTVPPPKQVQLTGFLRADGNLSVLGIISISMEFYLGLTYLSPGKSYGTATVSVSVSVLFVSVSVGVTMQKTIGGSGDPDFKQALTAKNWAEYCGGLRVTKQRVLWTACPHGQAGGKLRVAVHVGPQLFPTGNVTSTLSEFRDWEEWPATQVSFKVKIGSATYDADIISPAPSLPLWKALFSPTIPVEPYEYSSPTSSPLYSYPAGFVRNFFQNTYTALADTAPVGAWPGVQVLTSEDYFGALPLNGRDLDYEIGRVKAMFPEGGGPIPPATGPQPATDLTQAYLFLQPLTKPAKHQTYKDTPRLPSPSSTSIRPSRC